MHRIDYKDLASTPDKTAQTTHTVVTNAVHLARTLADTPYPSLA